MSIKVETIGGNQVGISILSIGAVMMAVKLELTTWWWSSLGLVVALHVADMFVATPPGFGDRPTHPQAIRLLVTFVRRDRTVARPERIMVQMAVVRSLWLVMDRSLLRGRDERAESGFRRGVLDDGRFCYGGTPRAMLRTRRNGSAATVANCSLSN